MTIGSRVKVIHRGSRYESYTSYFHHHNIPDMLSKYDPYCDDGDEGVVLFRGLHQRGDRMLCVVETNNKYILIAEDALEELSDPACENLVTTLGDIPITALLGF